MKGSADRIRAATDALVLAAKQEGVEPSGPLGFWLRAQQVVLVAIADFAGSLEAMVDAVSQEMVDCGKEEAMRQHLASAEIRILLEIVRLSASAVRNGMAHTLARPMTRVSSAWACLKRRYSLAGRRGPSPLPHL